MTQFLDNRAGNGNAAVVPRPTGVTFDNRNRKYGAKIRANGKLTWLGTFNTMQEASDAFEAAKAERDGPKNKKARSTKPIANVGFKYLEKAGVSVSEAKQIVRYDPETGDFFWLERPLEMCRSERQQYWWSTEMAGRKVVGSKKKGFFKISLLAKKFYAHHVAWALVHGSWPTKKIIHVNGDRMDNRIINLQEAH